MGKAANTLTPHNPGEIKSDDANWYERNIVRPAVTWLNTRPGGPFITVLKAAASFIPGVGEALDIAEGSPEWAAVGAIPVVGDSVQAARRVAKEAVPLVQKVVKKAEPTLKELHDEFYDAASDAYKHVSNNLQNNRSNAELLKNQRYSGQVQKTAPTEMFSRDNVHHNSKIDHTYQFGKNSETGQTEVRVNTFSGRDMTYAGTRAGSELALIKHLKSSYPNHMNFPTEMRMLFKDDNNIANMSRLISLKKLMGINKPFARLSDEEIAAIVKRGYATGMFSVKKYGGIPESMDEVIKRVSPIIKKYSYIIPSVVGGTLLINEQTDANNKGDQ